ncbi:hypothetical protein EOPP23_10585 [Endozoicomonas sp. OPT23]|uniref:pepsin-like aspartic protease n=1 Tax=Endozoicomonas sp. OPT23 TaxID=2072845 RepID=UPI00129AEB1F|nr:pepsin-like aspartic protease [Endozoicomonas sp. OPT23]MRI33431.1 hypothetical protein [Endozoicomonas sp. OPT23]
MSYKPAVLLQPLAFLLAAPLLQASPVSGYEDMFLYDNNRIMIDLRTPTKEEWFKQFASEDQDAVDELPSSKPIIPITNQNKMQYMATFEAGSDNQKFTVLMDTGSTDIWVPGPKCSATGCINKPHFDPGSSQTFVNTNKPLSILYMSGAMNGTEVQDQVTLGGISVQNQLFALAHTVSPNFAQFAFDGIFGLAYPALSHNHVNSWVMNAYAQQKIDAPMFSFYLSNEINGANSKMIVGSPVSSYYEGDIHWHSQIKPTPSMPVESYYTLAVKGFKINGKEVEQVKKDCADTGCPAVVDTGSSFLLVSDDTMTTLYTEFPVHQNCDNIHQFDGQKVSITVDDQEYVIPVEQLIVKAEDSEGKQACVLAVDVSMDPGIDWTFGDSFLRSFYSIFDQGHKRVAFANLAKDFAAHEYQPEPRIVYVKSLNDVGRNHF